MLRPLFDWFRPKRHAPIARRRILDLECLETRLAPATFLVDNLGDTDDGTYTTGQVTLREAIRLANADPFADIIYFSSALSNSTIVMTGPTYALTTSMSISAVFGTTQAPGLVIDGGNARSIFQIDDGNNATTIDVTINGLTLTKGASTGVGGAVRVMADNLYLYNSTVSNSTALFGGGISLQAAGGVGGIVIGNTTISGNTAKAAGGGVLASGGQLALFCDTISGNVAGDVVGGDGGGLRVQDEAIVSSANCTFVDNRAKRIAGAGDGGGISSANSDAKRPTLGNTIVAGNLRLDGALTTPSDIVGLLSADSAFNLIGDAATSGSLANNLNNNIVGNNGTGTLPIGTIVYPKLTKNGGTTATHALVPNSPALNRGSNSRAVDPFGKTLSLEQRGSTFNRIVGGTVDIGAVEMQANESFSFFDVTVGSTPAGASPLASATAFGKFSGGANPDLAIADTGSSTIGIYLKTAANSYQTTAAITLSLPAGSNPSAIAVADFNGDGKPDFAVANSGLSNTATISIFLNTTTVAGTPTFAPRVDLNGPNTPIALIVANIDGDLTNRLDLVALSGTVNGAGDFTIGVLLGDGLGGFSANNSIKIGDNAPDASELMAPTAIAVGDLVGDAKPEIVITAANGETYLTNNSTPGALSLALTAARFNNAPGTAVAIGKADGDALNDIFFTTSAAGGLLIVYRNEGSGQFGGATYTVNSNPVAMQLVDVNTDGKNDVIVANGSLGTLSLLINLTNSTVVALSAPLTFHVGGTPRNFALGDVEGNGIPDLAISNGTAGTDLYIGNNGFVSHSYIVNTLSDVADGNFSSGNLSLREAIVLANKNPGRDTISFANSLTSAGAATLLLDSDLPAITDDLSIVGPGDTLLTLSGQNARRILTIDDGNNSANIAVSISGLRFLNGSADGGGAILSRENLTISKSTFATNQTGPTLSGGAIAASDAGSLTITDSTFDGNAAAATAGGAIFSERPTTISATTFKNNSALHGGAVEVGGNTTTISSSLFSANTADGTAGFGGAIRVSGGTVNVVNSTLSGNIAGNGGAIAVLFASSAVVTGSTITLNKANDGGGFRIVGIGSLFNSIVAGNTLIASTTANDISGTATGTSSNNLIGDTATSGGLTHNQNANIVGNSGTGTIPIASILNATLAANGGPTLTHALVQNSLAIGGGAESVPNFTRYDQRETGRDVGDPDIGAFEVQHPLAPVGVPTDDAKLFSPQPSFNANTAFVKGLYHATLLRDSEQSGLDYWTGQLAAGVSREVVALGFINSYENRANQVTFFYRYFLKRESESVGLNYHVDRLQKGVDEATVMTGFVLSPEFAGQNNNASLVNLMYYAILGRQADNDGFTYWKSQLDSGQQSREQVVNGFLRSNEGIARVIQSDYQSYLKHVADASGAAYFSGLIAAGNTFGAVASKILASDDFYFNRTIPNRG